MLGSRVVTLWGFKERSPLGPKNSGRCLQVVVVKRVIYVIKVQNGTSKLWPLMPGGRYSEVVVSSGMTVLYYTMCLIIIIIIITITITIIITTNINYHRCIIWNFLSQIFFWNYFFSVFLKRFFLWHVNCVLNNVRHLVSK